MAFDTLTSFARQLTTAEETSVQNYVTTQMGSGTTNGISYSVQRTGVTTAEGQPLALILRGWVDESSANAYIAFLNTFSPAPVYAQTVQSV